LGERLVYLGENTKPCFMKHLVLTLGTAALISATGFGQCSADFDFMGAPFGISPNPALGESFSEGEVNQPYDDVLHVILPTTTGAIPGAPLDVPLDSLVLDSLNLVGEMGESISLESIGLSMSPNNNGDSGNPNAFLGGGQYCASITGTPDTAGVFLGQFFTTAWVTVPIVGPNAIPFPLEGYTLIINPEPIPGCMDEMACNYNAEATEDDGSCTYPEPLVDCNGDCLYDPDGDGICNDVEGCMDDAACNYDPNATVDDGMCAYPEDYYDCDGNCVMDMDGDGVCDELEVMGCDDMDACNYDEMATENDGSCEYPAEYYDCMGDCLNDADDDGICDELEVAGCTSPYACNYDESATDDDGSCQVVGDACDDGDETTINDAIDENCDCVGEVDNVAETAFAALEVYPNPAQGVLNVVLPQGQAHQLTLVSVLGAASASTQALRGGLMVWEVADLPAGAYLLHVEGEHGRAVRQILLGTN
jgi:hypothetical protein